MEVRLEFRFCKRIFCFEDGLHKHFVAALESARFLPVLSVEEGEFFFHIFKKGKKNDLPWMNVELHVVVRRKIASSSSCQKILIE